MSNDAKNESRDIAAQLPNAGKGTLDSFSMKGSEGYSESVVDAIEMIGEEKASGYDAAGPSEITPGMRYLHSSRTIHQLVTDRNRAVGIYLAVASLLLTASGAIVNAKPSGDLMIPIEEIQRWCLPLAFASLALLGFFIAFLLIRTRVGLIYEVAKMNVLLGLPIGRVQRFNPLSIHFILQALVSCAGGASSAMFTAFMIRLENPQGMYLAASVGSLVGIAIAVFLIVLDYVTVGYTTADHRLQSSAEKK